MAKTNFPEPVSSPTRVANSSEVSIDKFRKILDRAEESGATHVAIDYHHDHDEYEIYGFKMERATEEDILDNEKLITSSLEIENSIQDLKYQIRLLEDKKQQL